MWYPSFPDKERGLMFSFILYNFAMPLHNNVANTL